MNILSRQQPAKRGLPDAIGQLTGLETLILTSNQLTALPKSIVALTNLTWLNLQMNPRLIRTAQTVAVTSTNPIPSGNEYASLLLHHSRESRLLLVARKVPTSSRVTS